MAEELDRELAWSVVRAIRGDAALATGLAEALAPHAGHEDDGWMTTAEAARYLGLSAEALQKLAARGEVPNVQSGPRCKRWFRKSAVDRWRDDGTP